MSEQRTNKTVLGPDCRISGELSLDNDAVIMGQFKGTLRVSGVLEVTESGRLGGTIIAGAIRLAGHVEANVVAEHGVELLAGAHLAGQLYTTMLSVVEGAVLQSDVCVGPKAMQAAGALLRQVQVGAEEVQDDAPAPSIGPSAPEAADTQDRTDWQDDPQEAARAAADDADLEAETEAMPIAVPVRTVPSGLNSMLSRRRPKVLGSGGLRAPEGDANPMRSNPAAKAS